MEPCPERGQLRPSERMCARDGCGATFRRRADAIYCTPRCARIAAQRAYRERKTERVKL